MYSQGCDPDNKKSRKKSQIYGGLRVKYDITCDQITATNKKKMLTSCFPILWNARTKKITSLYNSRYSSPLVNFKKSLMKKSWSWGDKKVREGAAGSTLSCGSLSGWDRCFQTLRRSLPSLWRLENKIQIPFITIRYSGKKTQGWKKQPLFP